MNSKRKGCAGEREFAAMCRQHGFDEARRGQQFQGGIDTPDVKGLPGIHVEVKRVEKLNIHEAMTQSIRDAAGQAVPIVAHRRNRGEWLITMRAGEWFKLLKASIKTPLTNPANAGRCADYPTTTPIKSLEVRK